MHNKKIITDKGHCWITFDNGYTLSVFNGYGSYSDNYYNNDLILYPINEEQKNKYAEQRIASNNCEIAIFDSNGTFVTNNILNCDDDIKGYVSVNELIEIINKVNDLENKGE